jgi:hypothetical protein
MTLTNSLPVLAIIAVLVVLVMGLINMMRGGSSNRSQMLMRWRVGLQFLAILLIMAVLWFTQRGT